MTTSTTTMYPYELEPAEVLADPLAQICAQLRPFQTLEYDPKTRVVSIVTEWLVPGSDTAQMTQLLARRGDDEKLTVRRFADNYKISLARRLRI
ncbi:MAG: hypothetical protein H6645_12785 [Caldilineaceae bacterium]|nr:hypothetical protein [Caldilineaceae bacterium]